jgi:flavin reductase (DIM6/NTAB) family NADH-FMN oxidoreductase RutF
MIADPSYDGDPAAAPDEFRRCLGQFATGVTVVTANVQGELVGLTVNSFASVSLNPPLILWSIDVSSNSYAKFSVADSFIINVLADDQIALSRHFGCSGADKFGKISWSTGSNGARCSSNAAPCCLPRAVIGSPPIIPAMADRSGLLPDS